MSPPGGGGKRGTDMGLGGSPALGDLHHGMGGVPALPEQPRAPHQHPPGPSWNTSIPPQPLPASWDILGTGLKELPPHPSSSAVPPGTQIAPPPSSSPVGCGHTTARRSHSSWYQEVPPGEVAVRCGGTAPAHGGIQLVPPGEALENRKTTFYWGERGSPAHTKPYTRLR